METQNRWGLVLLAAGFAGVAIVVALGTIYFENRPGAKVSLVVAAGRASAVNAGSEGEDLPDWLITLREINPLAFGTSTVEMRTGGLVGLSPTDALAQGLAENYTALTGKSALTEKERQKILEDIVRRTLPEPNIEAEVTVSDLNVSDTAPLDVYAGALVIILRKSAEVREYEAATFARAVRENNYSGSPELKEAATIYHEIRGKLIAMEVPTKIASEHTRVVSALGALANIVTLMGAWNGDPVVGLTYLNAFSKTENDLSRGMDALFARLKTLALSQT